MKEWLSGRKTYAIAFLLVVLSSYEVVIGELPLSQAIAEGRVVEFLQALALATIRAGIAKVKG